MKERDENDCKLVRPIKTSKEIYTILGNLRNEWDISKRKVLKNEWDGRGNGFLQ